MTQIRDLRPATLQLIYASEYHALPLLSDLAQRVGLAGFEEHRAADLWRLEDSTRPLVYLINRIVPYIHQDIGFMQNAYDWRKVQQLADSGHRRILVLSVYDQNSKVQEREPFLFEGKYPVVPLMYRQLIADDWIWEGSKWADDVNVKAYQVINIYAGTRVWPTSMMG